MFSAKAMFPPAKKYWNNNNKIQQSTFLCITFFLMVTDFLWDSVVLYCPACSMSQKPSTLDMTVDQQIYRSKTFSNLSKNFPFLRFYALKPWHFSAMLWVRVSCHATNKKNWWLVGESLWYICMLPLCRPGKSCKMRQTLPHIVYILN